MLTLSHGPVDLEAGGVGGGKVVEGDIGVGNVVFASPGLVTF